MSKKDLLDRLTRGASEGAEDDDVAASTDEADVVPPKRSSKMDLLERVTRAPGDRSLVRRNDGMAARRADAVQTRVSGKVVRRRRRPEEDKPGSKASPRQPASDVAMIRDSDEPRFPGLGKAVVMPPPGYDPSNPPTRGRKKEQSAKSDANGPRTQPPVEPNHAGLGDKPARSTPGGDVEPGADSRNAAEHEEWRIQRDALTREIASLALQVEESRNIIRALRAERAAPEVDQPASHPSHDLVNLFRDLFDASEMRRFFRFKFASTGIADSLPGPPASKDDVAASAAEATVRHGIRASELARELLRERPHRSELISRVVLKGPTDGVSEPVFASHRERQIAERRNEIERELALGSTKSEALLTELRELKREQRSGPQLFAGMRLGPGERYELLSPLGRGGVATVWRVYDVRLHRVAAMKVLHGQLYRDETVVRRFWRGARMMAQLDHPAVVPVTDLPGEASDGYHYFVMPYYRGGDLAALVGKGVLGATNVSSLVERIGGALHVAHADGLVHRDVKPANILIDSNGKALLTDFDLVKAPDTTGLTTLGGMGSFLYQAPEQARAAATVSQHADQFALAQVAVFALRGRPMGMEELYNPSSRSRALDAMPCGAESKTALSIALAAKPEDRHESIYEFCIRFCG